MAIALIAQGRFNEPTLSSFCKFSVLPRAGFYALPQWKAGNEFSTTGNQRRPKQERKL